MSILDIISHEIPQEFGDFTSLVYAGFAKSKTLFFNFLSDLMAVLGIFFLILPFSYIENLVNFLVHFAVENFLYITSADLIPQLHKEPEGKNQSFNSFFFLLGILIMFISVIFIFSK